MAKYHRLYDDNIAHLESCSVNRNTCTIIIDKPTTAIKIHRDLADLFDEPDWIVEVSPTMRIHDELIEINYDFPSPFHRKWSLQGKHNITKGMIVERT